MSAARHCSIHKCVCRRARLTLFVAGICLAISGGKLSAQPPDVAWVVDAKSQNWRVNKDKSPLVKGTYLPGEGMISNAAPSEGDYLTVANMRGEIIRRMHCSNTSCGLCIQNDSCANPIPPLPKAPEGVGYLEATVESLRDLFGEHPERYSVHRSRGIGQLCATEGVSLLGEDGKARLDSLLKNCEQGTYTLEFRAVGSKHESSGEERSKQISVDWSPLSAERQFALDLISGLYRVEYTRGWMSGTAWLLLSSPAAYKKSSESFNRFNAIVESWGDQVETETKVSYRRALLDHLSQRTATQ